jgi:hypothetical protein
MKSFIEYLNEAMKKPSAIQGVFSSRARKARKVYDERRSDARKSKVKWREAEAKLNRDMNWNTNTSDIET